MVSAPRYGEACAELSAPVDVVVAAEGVELERERGRDAGSVSVHEDHVRVPVAVEADAVDARSDVVVALREVENDLVGGVAERGVDLDLGVRAVVGARARAERTGALVQDQPFPRALVPGDPDGVRVDVRRSAARLRVGAEGDLSVDDLERRLASGRGDGGHGRRRIVERARLRDLRGRRQGAEQDDEPRRCEASELHDCRPPCFYVVPQRSTGGPEPQG